MPDHSLWYQRNRPVSMLNLIFPLNKTREVPRFPEMKTRQISKSSQGPNFSPGPCSLPIPAVLSGRYGAPSTRAIATDTGSHLTRSCSVSSPLSGKSSRNLRLEHTTPYAHAFFCLPAWTPSPAHPGLSLNGCLMTWARPHFPILF